MGDHLGVSAEDESAATHRFAATLPGYRGWQWEVVVAAPPGADRATVSESALLPGPDALVAPDFVPWDQRVRPGDLSPGDLLATAPGDPRLVPGYVDNGDPEVAEVALEIGLGRSKVLSEEGRLEAAERWYSEFGPGTEMAKAAPATCGLCGFYLPLAGAMRAAFGVCANAMGADGRVVHTEYGCGAHSDVEIPTGAGSPLYEAFDDAAFDVIPAEELRKSAEGVVTEAALAQPVSGSETEDVPVAQDAEVDAEGLAAAPDTEVAAGTETLVVEAERVEAGEAAPESETPVAEAERVEVREAATESEPPVADAERVEAGEAATESETPVAEAERVEAGEPAAESASAGQSDQPVAEIVAEPTAVEAADTEASTVDAGAQDVAVADGAAPADTEAVVAEGVSDEVGAPDETSESGADEGSATGADDVSATGADEASATGAEEASAEAENAGAEAERSESGSSSPN